MCAMVRKKGWNVPDNTSARAAAHSLKGAVVTLQTPGKFRLAVAESITIGQTGGVQNRLESCWNRPIVLQMTMLGVNIRCNVNFAKDGTINGDVCKIAMMQCPNVGKHWKSVCSWRPSRTVILSPYLRSRVRQRCQYLTPEMTEEGHAH